MADVTPILIKDLAAQTTLADSDYFIVGGADAKKITVAQMKEALGINELNTKNIFDSWTCNYNLLAYAQDIGAGHFSIFNYNGYGADGPINAAPTNAHGMGIACNRDGNYIILVVFPYENSSTLGQAFIRTKQGGNWGGWNQIK